MEDSLYIIPKLIRSVNVLNLPTNEPIDTIDINKN